MENKTLGGLLEQNVSAGVILSVLEEYAKDASVNPTTLGDLITTYSNFFSLEEMHRAYSHCEIGMQRQFANGFPTGAHDYLFGMAQLAEVIAKRDDHFDTNIYDSDSKLIQVKKLLVKRYKYCMKNFLDDAISVLKDYVRGELPKRESYFYEGFTSLAQQLDAISLVDK